jgi:ketosteroid isomerase-like protein
MRRRRAPDTDVDELEQAFYGALQTADLEAVMACWADDDEVLCIHPGGERLLGLHAIRASYASIFSAGAIPVRPEQVHRSQVGTCSIHSVVESVEVVTSDGVHRVQAVATNVYVKTARGWRLMVHHASPAEVSVASAPSASKLTLH